jgi:hypothetical protein
MRFAGRLGVSVMRLSRGLAKGGWRERGVVLLFLRDLLPPGFIVLLVQNYLS